jgi:hypothetical protein
MWLLLACQPEPTPATPVEDDSRDTASDEGGDVPEVIVEIPAASLSAAAVAQTIEGVFASGLPSPLLPRRTYLEAFSGRDSDCPGGDGYNLSGAFQGCTAASGWLYAGVAEYQGAVDPDVLRDFSLLADCYMVDPDGNWHVAAGELLFVSDGDGSGGSMLSEISGTFSYAPAGGWMEPEGSGAVLTMEAQWTDTGWSATLDGSVTDGTSAVRLGALSAGSGQCGGVPVGAYKLRGEGGYWYTLTADKCGCGMVTYADGSELGEACVDISAALLDLLDEVRQ